MQLLLDFFPIIAFFAAYQLAGVFVATAVIIVAVLGVTAYQWHRHQKLNPMTLVTAVVVLIFGSLTLTLHNEMFIKWKVTVVYWLLASVLFISQFVGGRSLIRRMLGSTVQLPDATWKQLNLIYTGFFIFLGALNLYVVYHFSTDVWVKFKFIGLTALLVVFAIAQSLWLAPKMIEPDKPSGQSE
jgi:intracellular septation protein